MEGGRDEGRKEDNKSPHLVENMKGFNQGLFKVGRAPGNNVPQSHLKLLKHNENIHPYFH